MILELRAEIDAFLKIAPAPPDVPLPADQATAGSESVARGAVAEVVAVAGTPEVTA